MGAETPALKTEDAELGPRSESRFKNGFEPDRRRVTGVPGPRPGLGRRAAGSGRDCCGGEAGE